jgi:SAM-dependent methyltransferase
MCFAKDRFSKMLLRLGEKLKSIVKLAYKFIWKIFAKIIINKINLSKNRRKKYRCLVIGPGTDRISGFETLDINVDKGIDYVLDCSKKLPFENGSFKVIYASHVLEHIPWYMVEGTLKEWVRTLKSGGQLEIWVPNGLKICKAFVDAELYEKNYIDLDGWYKFNPEKDSCVWAAGRIYTYGDGYGSYDSANWHRAIFSPRYLKLITKRAGLKNIEEMKNEEIRGSDHGWINYGLRGIKP